MPDRPDLTELERRPVRFQTDGRWLIPLSPNELGVLLAEARKVETLREALAARRICFEGALADMEAMRKAHTNGSAAADPDAHDLWAVTVSSDRIALLQLAIRQVDAALEGAPDE